MTDKLKELLTLVEGFCSAVDDATRAHDSRGLGGQQVPFHGDFASALPSTMIQLRWWARELRTASRGVAELQPDLPSRESALDRDRQFDTGRSVTSGDLAEIPHPAVCKQ